MSGLEAKTTGTHHEAENSQVTEENFVDQDGTHGAGIAVVLTARNMLTGPGFPNGVREALGVMEQRGSPPELLGQTRQRDRQQLVEKLNTFQETQLDFEVVKMPSDQDAYLQELLRILQEGGLVLAGVQKPYFELPPGAVVETVPGSSHGILIHGFKQTEEGPMFTVTDPEREIADRYGINIDVAPHTLYDCLSDDSRGQIEVISVAG